MSVYRNANDIEEAYRTLKTVNIPALAEKLDVRFGDFTFAQLFDELRAEGTLTHAEHGVSCNTMYQVSTLAAWDN